MRGSTSTEIDNLGIRFGHQGVTVENDWSFEVTLDYEYEPPIKSTEDEPACEEYFEIWNIQPQITIWFKMPGMVEIMLDSATKLEYILSDSALEALTNKVLKELKENYEASQIN